jgi:hypothetical protein
MANSKLLKEAIADAKAVKETALQNAKIALEEAFTPRLQSILSQKMRAEAEDMEDDAKKVDEELSSDGIGSKVDAGYAETPGATPSYDAITDLSVGVKKDSGKPEQAGTDYKKVADISEEENPFADDQEGDKDAEIAELKARLAELEGEDSEEENPFAKAEGEDEMGMDDMGMDSEMGDDSMDMGSDDEESEDDMDLEAIIRELEASINGEEDSEKEEGMYEAEEEEEAKNENLADGSEAGTDKGEDPKVVVTNEEESKEDDKDVVDLEEILREMEADMKDDKEKVDEEEDKEELKADLNEAYKTIKSLQKTINEVNLLNAKLLFANKLFRAHNMTNEQKVKVIETLDRTNSVREVKLVYSTLAENFKYSSNKSTKKSISEGIASKVTKSTKPAQAKQVIAENTNFSDRFKKLAGIIK